MPFVALHIIMCCRAFLPIKNVLQGQKNAKKAYKSFRTRTKYLLSTVQSSRASLSERHNASFVEHESFLPDILALQDHFGMQKTW